MQFDRNGVQVRNTQPVRELRTAKRIITIDSRDRDPTKYVKVNGGAASSDSGDFVVYLPRVYENVVALRLRSAIIAAPTGGFTDKYVLLSIEGLDKIDETSTGAQRSGLVDSAFAKLSNPNMTSGTTNNTFTIFYNDKVDEENVTRYTPPIGRLDRMHIQVRYHPATSTGGSPPCIFGSGVEHTFTFEVEFMENGFDDFSSFETMLGKGR